MKHFLYLMAIAVCEAARIPRQLEYEHFPNFRSVYHGHGASSYQNVHVDNHGGGVPAHSFNYVNGVSDLGLTDHHGRGFVPIYERGNELGHVDGHHGEFSTYGGTGSGHHGLEVGAHPYYGGHFDHGNYFGDHLGHGLQ
ncbi:hypothetical protein KPH14_010278 [Odynerus spinipes]|uniref:Uncharacterized protein n=1 Tax=Odynerus spinipes TaxID=1348599 RepID=A0AAD9VST6_9HYME|nr:hypothetical protein KPH14_010278 [Odynerus spinipes]